MNHEDCMTTSGMLPEWPACVASPPAATLPDESQPVTPAATASRKRRRTNAAPAATCGGADALEAITRYMVAKQRTAVPESETEVFARHGGNEMTLVCDTGRRKRLQLEILHLIFEAQLEEAAV